jgi:hypothetical protein
MYLALMCVSCVLLTACDEEWKEDNRPIARNDFAMIQLETDICRHAASEGACLQHLKARIE